MSSTEYQLAAGGVGLCASIGMMVIAIVILLRRADSASLFVEDRYGYLIAKGIAAAVIAVAGIHGFQQSLEFVLKIPS